MVKGVKSVLVVGFNTRPLAQSLKKGGYDVYAVDFFGDLDLYPNIKDCLIVTKKLGADYNSIKDNYSYFLARFTIDLIKEYPYIDYLIIGSGLDDALKEREFIYNGLNKENHKILDINNDLDVIKKARDIKLVYNIIKSLGYNIPITLNFENFEPDKKTIPFPFIIKKKTGSGGVNVYKINNTKELSFFKKNQEINDFIPSDWLVQEFIEGIPISCTVIANGIDCEVITINRQIIGLDFLNVSKEFMYCGNITPANLFKSDNELISEISLTLTKELGLKGINGFDFVLKNHYPYLMEINPRIPGSISVSESVLDLNLLDLYIKSFDISKWEQIKNLLKSTESNGYTTKLIFFAPKVINKEKIDKINCLDYIHDKTEPIKNIFKGEPICTILFNKSDFSASYFGALKIVDEIKKIIN